jgi:integrase
MLLKMMNLERVMPLTEITPHIVHKYLKTRHSNHNYNVHRKEIRALFNFAINHLEIINYNPVRKLEVMPHTADKKHIPIEEEVLRLIMAADPKTERPLIQVCLHTLGRIDEILRLTWEDVKGDDRK